MTNQIIHYPTCTSNYPEKTGEAPQQLTTMDIGDGEVVVQCVDCGAHKVIRKALDA